MSFYSVFKNCERRRCPNIVCQRVPRQGTSNRKGTIPELCFLSRQDEVVVCCRAKCWAPLDLREVGTELSNACRRLSVQCRVSQQPTFELHYLRNTQPVKFAPQKWRHVVVPPPAVYNSDCVVQNGLNALHLTGWDTRKKTVAIIYSGNHEAVDQLNGRSCQNRTSNCSNPSKLIKHSSSQAYWRGLTYPSIRWSMRPGFRRMTGWDCGNIAVRQMQCAVLNKM